MKVNKEIFYHANSGNEVKVGDTLVFNSKTHNRMYDEIYNNEFKLDGIDANELLINKKKNKDRNLSVEEFEMTLNTINNDSFVMRELALEEVRKSKYPDSIWWGKVYLHGLSGIKRYYSTCGSILLLTELPIAIISIIYQILYFKFLRK